MFGINQTISKDQLKVQRCMQFVQNEVLFFLLFFKHFYLHFLSFNLANRLRFVP